MFIVPNGSIIFADSDCSSRQVVQGMYIAGNGFKSDRQYSNTVLTTPRCDDGGLTVQGTLIGDISTLIASRRSNLNNWFANTTKKDGILNGASLLIESNPGLRLRMPAGANELMTELKIYKK